jgi:hypothetical protein
MKNTKVVLAGAGVLGLLAVFVMPYITVEHMSLKFWDLRLMPERRMASGLLEGPQQVYVAVLGFTIALIAGAQAIAAKRMMRPVAIAGAVGCLMALATAGVRQGMSGGGGMDTAIGGKMLFLAAALGLVAAVVGAIKPDPQAA